MSGITDIKDLFQEDVQDKINEVKKYMNKEKGNLDRHTLRCEARIDSYRAELVMLGALLNHVPKRQPEIWPDAAEVEDNAEPVESSK